MEKWSITDLHEVIDVNRTRNPEAVYYVSDVGRIKAVTGSKEKIVYDPSKSRSKAKRFQVGGKNISLLKLVYHSFNNMKYTDYSTVVPINGDRSDVRLSNLKNTRRNFYELSEKWEIPGYTLGYTSRIEGSKKSEKFSDLFFNEVSNFIIYQGKLHYFLHINDKTFYINTDGDIYKFVEGKGYITKKKVYDDDGYEILVVHNNKYRVHRLIACAFNKIPYMNNLHVHHKDKNTKNNRLDNLELLTPSGHKEVEVLENTFGKKLRRFSDEDVRKIRELSDKGYSFVDIGRMYNSEHGTIRQIVKRITYKDVG